MHSCNAATAKSRFMCMCMTMVLSAWLVMRYSCNSCVFQERKGLGKAEGKGGREGGKKGGELLPWIGVVLIGLD